ncbi:hypothetical protein [Streptomyces sp. NPDC056165]|uniref:hypothetical protein n=1 Tax=Streptomyces sp. NPDC056165 TaxID=3345733 RepID=UPI0035E15057
MPACESRAQKWERVARLLKSENISNTHVAAQLGVGRPFVARVREDLGLPEYRRPTQVWTQEQFDAATRSLPGGHRLWLGRMSPDGTPMANRKLSAYRVAYQLHYRRDPVGRVEGTCTRKRCVAACHQEDDVLRAAQSGRVTLRGMDLAAMRKALRDKPPYPPLRLDERRMAFRLADPALGVVAAEVPVRELARRLGCCDETIRRWRDEGVPA